MKEGRGHKLDKLSQLNVGAFDRQVFLDGLRLRNSLIHSRHGQLRSHSLESNSRVKNNSSKVNKSTEQLNSGQDTPVVVEATPGEPKTSSFCLLM